MNPITSNSTAGWTNISNSLNAIAQNARNIGANTVTLAQNTPKAFAETVTNYPKTSLALAVLTAGKVTYDLLPSDKSKKKS